MNDRSVSVSLTGEMADAIMDACRHRARLVDALVRSGTVSEEEIPELRRVEFVYRNVVEYLTEMFDPDPR